MIESVQGKFIEKLEKHYGVWEKNTARFGTTSYGKVSKDLCISSSQFSKLIYGNATEGMYVRSIENIDRLMISQQYLLERNDAIAEREKALSTLASEQEKALTKLATEQEKLEALQYKKRKDKRKIFLYIISGLALMLLLIFVFSKWLFPNSSSSILSNDHPLGIYFEQEFDADFDSPYLREAEVQDYCPCSAYEGKWVLDKSFKLPLPGSKQPGLYYYGKSSDLRMKCSNLSTLEKGISLAGYEYLVSEIWIDTKQTALIPKYFNKEEKTFTKEFENLAFENQPHFKKVATLYAFNVNRFEIHPDSIVRKAELTGRYATDIDEKLALKYKIDVKHILKNVLGNLTKTQCESTENPFCNPNDLKEEESVIAFDCLYTIRTENLGIGGGYPYTKGFRLEKQSYSDNLTCDSCE